MISAESSLLLVVNSAFLGAPAVDDIQITDNELKTLIVMPGLLNVHHNISALESQVLSRLVRHKTVGKTVIMKLSMHFKSSKNLGV